MSGTARERLSKQPAEDRKFIMDFTNVLGTGETLTGIPSITSEKTDGSSSDLYIYSSGIIESDKKISLWIASGTDNTEYRVEIQAQTSEGQLLEGDGLLNVSDC